MYNLYKNLPPNKIHGVPYYFFYYYVVSRLSDKATFESKKIQEQIYKFKKGIEQNFFAYIIRNKILEFFNNPNNITLACVPASGFKDNEIRYKSFTNLLCSSLQMENGYDFIKLLNEVQPKHNGGKEIQKHVIDNHFFRGKNIIIFDDIVTSSKTMQRFILELEAAGGKVVACISLARTFNENSYIDLRHPYTNSSVLEYGNLPSASHDNLAPETPEYKN